MRIQEGGWSIWMFTFWSLGTFVCLFTNGSSLSNTSSHDTYWYSKLVEIMKMENSKKWKGGAEKIRAKKRQGFQADAAKCVKITKMFAGGLGGASSSAAATSEAATGNDGRGGRQVDEGKWQYEVMNCSLPGSDMNQVWV